MTFPSIMIATSVRNCANWLPNYWNTLKNIDYPKSKIRVVFSYGPSNDQTLNLLKQFKKEKYYNVEVYRYPPIQEVHLSDHLCAGIFDDWKKLISEDYFMLINSKIIKMPNYLIKELLKVKAEVVAPYIWSEYHGYFYDTWKFRIDNKRFDPTAPPGLGLEKPIYVDSVGSCFITPRKLFKEVPIINPYPSINYCNNLLNLGWRIVACPYLEVYHERIREKYDIIDVPLAKEYGGYPKQEFINYTYPVKTLDNFVHKEFSKKFYIDKIKRVEQGVMEMAKLVHKKSFRFQERSLNWIYNYNHFGIFYYSRNPYIQYLLCKSEIMPKYCEIEPTTYCNLKCTMCERTYWNEKSRHLSLKEYKMIIDQFDDLKQIGVTGIGEMLLNKDFIKMIEYTKTKFPDVFMEMFDSFSMLDKIAAKKLIEAGIDKMYVSLDAATKETYEKLRVGANWDKVIKNIKDFDIVKKELGYKHFPWLCFHFVVMKPNVHEMMTYLEFINSLDVNVEFVQYSKILHKFKEIEDLYIEIPKEARQKTIAKAKELGITTRWNVNVPEIEEVPMKHCLAWTQPFVFVTGEVIPCCAMNEGNQREFQKRTSMGNVFKDSLKDIWYGEKFKKLRSELYNNKLPEACVPCPIFKKPSVKRL